MSFFICCPRVFEVLRHSFCCTQFNIICSIAVFHWSILICWNDSGSLKIANKKRLELALNENTCLTLTLPITHCGGRNFDVVDTLCIVVKLFILDYLDILKRTLWNFKKILKNCFLSFDTGRWCFLNKCHYSRSHRNSPYSYRVDVYQKILKITPYIAVFSTQ